MGAIKMAFLALPILYVLAWFITLCGIASSQAWCDDQTGLFRERLGYAGGGFFAWEMGGCTRYFRFAWWIWVFSTLPVALSFAAPFLRHAKAPSNGLFYIVLPILMIFTNAFNNLSEVEGIDDSGQNRLEVATAGFALQTIFGLLIIVLTPFLGEHDDQPVDYTSGKSATAKGGRATPSAETHYATPSGTGHVSTPLPTTTTVVEHTALPSQNRMHTHTTTMPAQANMV